MARGDGAGGAVPAATASGDAGFAIYRRLLAYAKPHWPMFMLGVGTAQAKCSPIASSGKNWQPSYVYFQTGSATINPPERKKIADYCANVKNFQGLMFKWDMKDGVPTNKPLYIFEIESGKKKFVQEVRPQ